MGNDFYHLGEESVCEKKYNGYYSFGDCGEMDDVHSFEECCELTKEAQLLQPDRGIIRFSYNGHKYEYLIIFSIILTKPCKIMLI